ncbi:replication initiator protein [Dipodfec virus UOA04_Rod_715]|nr:replication initiator protein [Dipodfec virus UOA04_Rod_715]
MCLFPKPNNNITGEAFRRGLTMFDCGECPECLSKRARSWSLRACCAALEYPDNCMITLTYDNYARNSSGDIIGELPPDRDLHVCKRDVQLFIKRLRKHFSDRTIKYLITAEYGSRTHRAHYHAILFNVSFDDLIVYKRSSRNNLIYKSPTLTKLWGHGICTVDCIRVNASVAAYCTKYCAKSRSEDTFMLFSRGIGDLKLMELFNGRYYCFDGRYYPIPRLIWDHYIMSKYPEYDLSNRYVAHDFEHDIHDTLYNEFRIRRQCLSAVRRSDPVYTAYLEYWTSKCAEFEALRPSPIERLNLLPDSKYYLFKIRAREALHWRSLGYYTVCPFSRAEARADERHLAYLSCHNTPNDTKILLEKIDNHKTSSNHVFLPRCNDVSPFLTEDIQLSFGKELNKCVETLDFYNQV